MTTLQHTVSATPPTPTFPPAIEYPSAYEPQSICSAVARPGAVALRSLVLSAYRGTGDLGIVRACGIGGTSEHKEGRAWDWKINAFDPAEDAAARDMFAWLLATDENGNEFAVARRLGIMYMIYNRRIWSASNAAAGWRAYSGPNAHTDHVHLSLNLAGGDKLTSYWTGKAAVSATQPIEEHWEWLGGSSGRLGARVGEEYGIPGGRAQEYRNGKIYRSVTTGARAVYGSVLARYEALGGPAASLGLPISDELTVTGGRAAHFQRGRIYSGPGTGAHPVYGQILARYLTLGGPEGDLGLPTSAEAPAADGRMSGFQGGRVYWNAASGARFVQGLIAQHYVEKGGHDGYLGVPISDEVAVPGGRGSVFRNGHVLWSPATGAQAVQGAIDVAYTAAGGAGGTLGLPVSDETDVAGVPGARESTFQGGRLLWSALTGAHPVHGAIGAAYQDAGGPAAFLGLPTSAEVEVSPGVRMSSFQGGRILWSSSTGAHVVRGAIAVAYDSLGGPGGELGLPTSDEVDAPGGGRMSEFVAGRIYWSAARGTRAVRGQIMLRYLEPGAAADLGQPVTEETDAGPGARFSGFERGRIFWSAPTGARIVSGAVLAHHDSNGAASGFLGLPVDELTRVTATVSQQVFLGGTVYVTGRGARHVRGALRDRYLQLGGPTGRLAAPVSDEYAVPEGRRSDFERGALIYVAATGQVIER